MQILITGAGKGIGFEATAFALAKGHHVIALSRQVQALQKLQATYPQSLEILALDLANPHEIAHIEPCLLRAGKVDALIHNAGVLINKPFLELTEDDWATSWSVNLMAIVRITKTCLPYMGRAGKAHIINVSSMGGFQGSSKFAGLASYSTTKGALVTFTECLAVELQDKNIHVNCLCLGAVATEMLQQAFPAYQAPITAKEMGEYLITFATEQMNFYNGKILPVAVSVP